MTTASRQPQAAQARTQTSAMSRRAWFFFVLVSILWGVPYFFIKVALHDLTPSMIAFTRVVIGTVTLLPIALSTGALRKLRGRLGSVVLLSLLEVVVPFLLIATGEQRISSSLTGILIASEPMFIALLAIRFDIAERVGARQFGGLLVGLIGVVVLLGLDLSGKGALVGAGMVLLATFCYAAGALLMKLRFSDVPFVAVATASLGLSAVFLAVPGLITLPPTFPAGATVVSVVILGIACTAAGFVAFFVLISLAGAGRATTITYVAPAVAVLFGVVIGGESFGLSTAAGLGLILAGSWVATQRSEPRDRALPG